MIELEAKKDKVHATWHISSEQDVNIRAACHKAESGQLAFGYLCFNQWEHYNRDIQTSRDMWQEMTVFMSVEQLVELRDKLNACLESLE